MAVSSEQIEKALRTSLKEAERLRQQNQQLLAQRNEPIAIVGMSCRFPGGVVSPDDLWEMLTAGGNGISTFPDDRGWDTDGLYNLTPEQIEAGFGYYGGFLEEAGNFDPAFFDITPREALAMDPQQRQLLEGAWEALEDAGIDPTALRGTDTGVFAGLFPNSYLLESRDSEEVDDLKGYISTGAAISVASGRLAYAFGLEGPAVSIDTACSSSLLAIHLAAQALRNNECQLALAGGVTGLATPHLLVEFQSQGGLAPDGQCKSFSADADGISFSEGLGLLVLERLSDAKRNRRQILALVKGSATNQDGASNGLTAPNGPSQERVIRQALANAGLNPSEVDAVEGHGTGTTLGDPIEAKALLATYGQDREEPLRLGCLKSNLGHTQAAAGVAGVIKMVMALREETLPQTLHVDEANQFVDWSAGEIELLRDAHPWPKRDRPRRAGVSAFGLSGTNAHLILEEAPEQPVDARPTTEHMPLLPWALSAKSPEALAAAARRLATHIREEDLDPADVAHTLIEARAQLEHRAVVIGADRDELLAGLDALAENRPAPNLVSGRASSRTKMAFIFPGHGSQWLGMARELLDESPQFAASIERCEAALAPYMERTVTELLRSEDSEWLSQPPVQPTMFAVMVSLVELWRAYGVEPNAFVGHSQGEVSAAVACGAISLEEGARLSCLRAEMLLQLFGTGTLVAANLSVRDAGTLIEPFGGEVSVAAINGPSAVLLACSAAHVEELIELLESSDVRHKPLGSPVATHSHHVEVLRGQMEETFADLSPREVSGYFYSTVTAEPIATAELDADYWYRNMRQPVRLHETFQALLGDGYSAFIEASGHPVLSMSMREAAEAESKDSVAVLHSLRRGEGGMRRMLTSLAEAHVQGVAVDLSPALAGSGGTLTKLPTYPFQRQRYWVEGSFGAGNVSSLGQSAAEHPLLGAAISLASEETHLFTGRISLQTHPWVADHSAAETVILPGTAFLELALRAGREVGAEELRELILEAPLVIPSDGALQVQVSLTAGEDGAHSFLIHARPEPSGGEALEEAEPQGWSQHASGLLSRQPAPSFEFDATVWPPRAEPIAVEDFYDRLAEAGFTYGPAFQGVEAAWREGDYCYADVSLAAEQEREASRFGVHPALLDAALHTAFVSVDSSDGPGAMLPFCFNGVRLHRPQGPAALRVRVALENGGMRLEAADPEGSPVVSIASIKARPVDPELFSRGSSEDKLLVLRWRDFELPTEANGESEAAGIEVFECKPDPRRDCLDAAHHLCAAVLERLQAFLASAPEESRLAFVTTGAQAVLDGEAPELAAAAVHGLVRSAQSEHPGRFLLLDSDGSEASQSALAAAMQVIDEPLLAFRDGLAKIPRLTKQVVSEAEEAGSGEAVDHGVETEGTVLITGGLSGIGALTARHLAANHGVHRLLLVSRRGAASPGAAELIGTLAELGCEAEAVACDVSDRAQLAELIGSIPSERPLVAVYHSATILDDGLVENLDRERLDAVLATKADSAWFLHELTRDQALTDFVLYSSSAGIFGSPGQGNYAAANTFLDALATRRRAEGLAGTSIAWGLWARTSGLDEIADRDRLSRFGLVPIEDDNGTDLLDRARGGADSFVVAAPMQATTMRAAASAGILPPLLSELFKVDRRRARAAGGFLARRLASVPQEERLEIVLGVVREHAAAALGHSTPNSIDPGVNFKDLGFDSLSAVELRNRLAQATGVHLDVTIVFDRPTPEAIAAYLLEQVEGRDGDEVVVRAHRGSDEPIAIVGMACRFPGEVATPEEFWEMLTAGEDGTGPLPTDRGWGVESSNGLGRNGSGDDHVRRGGFLARAGDFDPAFFGISPREALAMDPQQRLVLECSWEAFEHGGIDVASLRGSSTGAFVGMSSPSYGLETDAWLSPDLEGYLLTGNSPSVASGRIAYILGLEGPALTIDTACSASLVAMHIAAQALQSGECDLALAGGVMVLGSPAVVDAMGRQGVLAADGRSKAFSAGADGMGIAEGAGMVLLERLSDANRNGREVLAVIKGSATNQDGASNGLTAPSGPSQERVIRQALANAGLEPSEIDAVEAHGTGTVLGDPIEGQALLATYGQNRETPLALGSVKSNLGHTQMAAGVAGVMKMVMALREEALPKTLHITEPTEHVDWSAGGIELLTEPRPWPKRDKPRRAGISSFGISGTNAHMIIEEAPERPAPAVSEAERPPLLTFALSAKAPEALRATAGRLAAHLEEKSPDLLDVSHTLLSARAQLEHRAVLVAGDEAELLEGLDAIAKGKGHESLSQSKTSYGPLAFLLSGQGSQRPQMGKGLYDSFPVYAQAFDAACDALAQEGIKVRKVLEADPGTELAATLDRTDLTQASLFALQVALYDLTSSFGIKPDYVLGHSVGEITAAHLAGVFDLAEAAKLLGARGRLMAALPEGGAMASIRATEQEVKASLVRYEGSLAVAAVNSPTQITVSGDADALASWLAQQEAEGSDTRALRVSHAFHSHRMEPMLEDFEAVAASLDPKAPQLPVISNRSGEPLTLEQAKDASYWGQQVRDTVRFADGLGYLRAEGTAAYLELGPAAALSALVAETDPGKPATSTLRHQRDDQRSFLGALATLKAAGHDPDFAQLFKDTGASVAELPSYPFQRERYWLEPTRGRGSGDASSLGQSPTDHPLLAASIPLSEEGSHLLTGRVSIKAQPWLADHSVAGTAVLYGAGLAELCLRAGREVGATHLQELTVELPVTIPSEGAVQLQVTVTPTENSEAYEVAVHSRPEQSGLDEEQLPFTCHATGTLAAEASKPLGFDATQWPPAGAEAISIDGFYERAAESGLEYGPAFQGIEAAWRLDAEIYAEVSLASEQEREAGRYTVHPALLDAALQPALLASEDPATLRLPLAFSGLSVSGGEDVADVGGASALRIRLAESDGKLGIEAADPDGNPVLAIEALELRAPDLERIEAAQDRQDFFTIDWSEIELPAATENGAVAPEVFPLLASTSLDPVAATGTLAAGVLTRLQEEIAKEQPSGSPTRLVFLSEGAVAPGGAGSPDPVLAAAWGLVRSAQSEHPGRFTLIDTDGSEASKSALERALAVAGEPQLALREGTAQVPRLTRLGESDPGQVPSIDPEGTILISGGLEGPGVRLARACAEELHLRRLLLAGDLEDAAAAEELVAELAELGCELTIAAGDLSDRAEVESLLASIPNSHPLTAIVHFASGSDEASVESLDADRLAAVVAARTDAAWCLHEATREAKLASFALITSAAATLGAPGQGGPGAADAFLEALAARRSAEGLPASAIAWRAAESDPSATPSIAHLHRADAGPAPVLAMSLQPRALRTTARAGLLPPLFSDLVRLPARRRAKPDGASLTRRLAGVAEEERHGLMLALVTEEAAGILGHREATAVDPERNLLELGFDSLGAVELRNRLATATGIEVAPTVALEHPTPTALATYLLDRVERGEIGGGDSAHMAGSKHTLRRLVDTAHAEGRMPEIATVLSEMSKFRPSFASAADLDQAPEKVEITRDGLLPRLICVPSFVVGSGPQQFARIARALSGRRPLTALALPGFRPGERLPSSWEAVVDVLAEVAADAAGGEPFVLSGFSAGGFLAYALAERLEREGTIPEGLALLDSPPTTQVSSDTAFALLLMQMLDRNHEAIAIDDDHLLAMAAYLRLIAEWRREEIEAPVLMLRAVGEAAVPTSPSWPEGATVGLPTDHFSMVGEDASLTAEAIDSWLAARPAEPATEATAG